QSEGKCEYCGVTVNESTAMVHHKIPINKGGSTDIDNFAIACPTCHILKADKILGTISAPVVESVAKLWIHAYLKAPTATSIISIVTSIIVGFTIYQTEVIRNQKIEQNLSQNLDFKAQIEQLNETENSLNVLLGFVTTQREKMTEYEKNIRELENEKQQLEPLVHADKKVVEALFKVQEQRAIENSSKERWIGFGLGILASIIASFVMVVGRYFMASKRENS
ncbi:MAG: hypothetical protein D3923_16435, partial [Candidatus Electrothrix sp. AR3]|nr:hypothetical protein [Candidatus Electrothrix sp. AR3]